MESDVGSGAGHAAGGHAAAGHAAAGHAAAGNAAGSHAAGGHASGGHASGGHVAGIPAAGIFAGGRPASVDGAGHAASVHILLVEDNIELNSVVKRALELRGYTAVPAMSLAEARSAMQQHTPDVILLDVMLPDGDGFSFCEEIRSLTTAHIIFLTAKAEQEDIVRGLAGGGDDYITKPFHPEELMARVGAAVRRRQLGNDSHILNIGTLTLDLAAARAFASGEDLKLTPKEFALLLLFAQNEGKDLTAEHIYETVWHMRANNDVRAVKYQVSHLREKLAQAGFSIFAVRGVGYRLERL